MFSCYFRTFLAEGQHTVLPVEWISACLGILLIGILAHDIRFAFLAGDIHVADAL